MAPEPSDPASFSDLHTDSPHAFVLLGPTAEIYSDFNHTGAIEYPEEEVDRDTRPGAVLLPVFPPTTIVPDYRTPVQLRPTDASSFQDGDELTLAFEHAADRRRVVAYTQGPNGGQPVLGDQQGSTTTIKVPAPRTRKALWMCATTLAGDPRAPAPTDRRPPPEVRTLQDTDNDNRPGEVWLRLGHQPVAPPSKKRRTDSPTYDDVALFQIAPLLLQSNLEPAERLYLISTMENHNFVYDVMEACWAAFGPDAPFDRDFGRKFRTSTPALIGEEDTVAHGECLLRTGAMYLIDDKYKDQWIQDQMAIGYCSAPSNRSVNVALHCKRNCARDADPGLRPFVHEEMDNNANRADEVFVFDGLAEAGSEETPFDSGGNIAVSPPVSEPTAPENTRRAGPPVPEHPPAPHGKLILGDCYNPHRQTPEEGQGDGRVHDQTRRFLQSQDVQPIVPVDTSWLEVGHVDEIMGFVPAPQDDRPAKLAMARPDVMTKLLERTKRIPVGKGRTHFHRGRYREPYVATGEIDQYDETSVEDLYTNERRQNNRNIRIQFLDPIEHRICHCTGLDRMDDVLPLPVYFGYADHTTRDARGNGLAKTCTPNVVNMQVLTTDPEETHVLVPRPCGPRLPPDDAQQVVQETLTDLGRDNIDVPLPEHSGFPFWAWPGLDVETLALIFTREKPNGEFVTAEEREHIIELINNELASYEDLEDEILQRAVEDTCNAIFGANPEAAEQFDEADPEETNLPYDTDFEDWYRLSIPENTVDILELYTRLVLEEIGCHVHFVDAWFYHAHSGGVHCGTNVLHEAPIPEEGPANAERSPWWQHYASLANANTIYDPNDTDHAHTRRFIPV